MTTQTMSVEEVVTLFADNATDLDKQVNQFLFGGWQLRGNLVVVLQGHRGVMLYQQMVRVHTESAKPAKS